MSHPSLSRRTFLRRCLHTLAGLGASLVVAGLANPALAAEPKKNFRLAWSIYAGYMPWAYADQAGILKKWADKYGIGIELKQVDYIESLNQYTAGQFDGVLSANIDALTLPAAGGVDTTCLIINDYSNGNDGIVLKGKTSLKDIKGQKVNLLELSVSHYFLARALSTVGLSERDIKVVNTSDADWVAAWTRPEVTASVAWNPQLGEMRKAPGTHLVFDSSKLPGELQDWLIVNTATLKANPAFGKALVGAWFETLAVMKANDARARAARETMAKMAGTDLPGFEAQLRTTYFFYTPADVLAFTRQPALMKGMDYMRRFAFSHGLLGQGAPDVNVIGIQGADGKVLGSPKNVKLRFDTRYVQLAAEGKL